jgi:hypothetical protein
LLVDLYRIRSFDDYYTRHFLALLYPIVFK